MVDNSVESSFVPKKQWSCTEVNVSNCSFTWNIKNMKFLENEKVIKSASFLGRGKTGSKWHLDLYPKGTKEEYKDFMSLFLNLESCLSSEINAKFKFSILNPKGIPQTSKKFEASNIFKPESVLSDFGYKRFLSRDLFFDETKGLIHGNKLSIVCEIAILDEIVNTPVRSCTYVSVPKCQLSEDLENLFANEEFSDVTLAADGCEYHVHKGILAARSKVFAKMFTHDMEESRSNHVNITDIGGDVCKEMLHFIYTGKAPNLHKVADGLLAAAEKYELTKLKAMCEEALTLKLNVENAAATLILADLHSADQLKAQTVNFIATHICDVLQTECWKNMKTSHLHLILETFVAIEKTKTFQTNSNN